MAGSALRPINPTRHTPLPCPSLLLLFPMGTRYPNTPPSSMLTIGGTCSWSLALAAKIPRMEEHHISMEQNQTIPYAPCPIQTAKLIRAGIPSNIRPFNSSNPNQDIRPTRLLIPAIKITRSIRSTQHINICTHKPTLATLVRSPSLRHLTFSPFVHILMGVTFNDSIPLANSAEEFIQFLQFLIHVRVIVCCSISHPSCNVSY
jgi:hypothetical protein